MKQLFLRSPALLLTLSGSAFSDAATWSHAAFSRALLGELLKRTAEGI